MGSILTAILIYTNDIYGGIFDQLKEGVTMTLGVSFAAYFCALLLAIIIGLIRVNPPKPPSSRTFWDKVKSILHTIVYNVATLYISIMRGLPILVVLLVTAFVLVPMIRDFINDVIVQFARDIMNNPDIPDLVWRGSSPPSAVAALAFTYAAYMSETIRAGIQSIGKGQVEASKSLGMTYFQTMRYIVLPQAFRNVLPPLGNDVIAMIKDSSLLALLGIRDITQIAKTSSGRSFRYMETYLVVAVLYLSMTILGSLLVRAMEDTLSQEKETPGWVQFLLDTKERLGSKKKKRIPIEENI